jgi:hypothetical protein
VDGLANALATLPSVDLDGGLWGIKDSGIKDSGIKELGVSEPDVNEPDVKKPGIEVTAVKEASRW